MDTDDARWYLEDDNNISNIASPAIDNFGNPSSSSRSLSADVAISIADGVDQPSICQEPHNKKPRLNVSSSTDVKISIADSVDQPSICEEPHNKKLRLNVGNPSSSSHSISADVAISIADSVDHPSISEEPHTKKPWLLARFLSCEAVAKAFGTIDE